MNSQETPNVLVAGAGPVGLAAAVELDRQGARVRIIDKAEARSETSKAAGINARTLELMEASGMTERFLAAGRKVQRGHIRDAGRIQATLDFSQLDHRYNFMLILPQSDTERLLEEHLAARGITVERQTELTAFKQEDDHVRCILMRPGETLAHRCSHLVAADGAHSTVRHLLGFDFAGDRLEDSYSLADVDADWPMGNVEADIFINGPDPFLVVIPLSDKRYRLISNSDDATDTLPEGAEITKVHWQSDFGISERMVRRFQQGRVFLAGDAAHIHSPAGGRGMNLGIEDACSLARRIMDGETAGYTAERVPRARSVLRGSGMMLRIISLRSGWARALRNFFLRHVLARPFFQKRLIRANAGLV